MEWNEINDILKQIKSIRAIDRQFASAIQKQHIELIKNRNINREANHYLSLPLAAYLVSRELGKGHVRVSPADFAGKNLFENIDQEKTEIPSEIKELSFPNEKDWIEDIAASPCVETRGQTSVCRHTEVCPLVLEDGFLSFKKYQVFEKSIASKLRILSDTGTDLSGDIPSQLLKLLFPSEKSKSQRNAALQSLKNPFFILSGGPGTGKTTTLSGILYLLLRQSPSMKIAAAAPTGKAASRIKESVKKEAGRIKDAVENIETKATFEHILEKLYNLEGVTIHRLLGFISGTQEFRHNPDNRLSADIVIIDEASMIDAAMMARLVNALKDNARFILLGDRHQLASVEAGGVFGDLSKAGEEKGYTISGSFSMLDYSFRFASHPGIGKLAEGVKEGDITKCINTFSEYSDKGSLNHSESSDTHSIEQLIDKKIIPLYNYVLEAKNEEEALNRLSESRVLCALRKGPNGAETINKMVEKRLKEKGLASAGTKSYQGRPLIITENDYNINLFNGYIGVLWNEEAVFPDVTPGKYRRINPSLLPSHESAYAMTVHKSQGSEFRNVTLILPENESQVLSKELIYTAVTRAIESFNLIGKKEILEYAIKNPVIRGSGLQDRLTPAS